MCGERKARRDRKGPHIRRVVKRIATPGIPPHGDFCNTLPIWRCDSNFISRGECRNGTTTVILRFFIGAAGRAESYYTRFESDIVDLGNREMMSRTFGGSATAAYVKHKKMILEGIYIRLT